MNIKVLHVAECVGGVDRYLRCLFKYSECKNVAVFSQLYNEKEYINLVDYIEKMDMKHKIGLNAFIEAFKLRNKIRKIKPDAVYAHSSIAGAIVRMACVGLNVSVIYNPHGWSFNMESRKKKVYVLIEKIMAYFCDAIVCISEAEKVSACRERICKEDKLHVICNGIDIDNYPNEEAELNIPKDAFVVGMVGRICKQKAPDVFVKMAGAVQEKVPNAYFVIVGDVIEGSFEERQKIEKLAKELNVNLIITGWVDDPLVYMKRFDVGCLLSRWEGFGLALPEYMLTSTPIVATRVDAIPYLIENEKNGLLVEKNDWKAASEAVLKLFHDKEMREQLIAQGLKDVQEKYNAKRVAEETDFLINLVDGEKNGRKN